MQKILCTQPQKVSRNDSFSCNEPCAFHLCKRFLHVSHKVGRGRIHGKSYDIGYRDLSAQNYTEFAAGAREYFDEITFCLNTLDNSFVYLPEGDTTAEYKAYTKAQRSAHEGLLKVEQNCFAYYIDDAAFGRMLTKTASMPMLILQPKKNCPSCSTAVTMLFIRRITAKTTEEHIITALFRMG